MTRSSSVVALCLAVAGCGRGQGVGVSEQADGTARVGRGVVATVDGQGIALDAVVATAQATALPPSEVVARLVDEELLAREARRRGFGAHPSVHRAVRQSAVQAYLKGELEAKVMPESINRETVARAFEQNIGRFKHAERRESAHILFMVKPKTPPETAEKARRLAEEAIADLRASTDYAATVDRLNGTFREGLQVFAEIVPPLERDAKADVNYLDAMFSLSKPGVVDRPVRSTFGWHAIALTRIIPPSDDSQEEVDAKLRSELVLPERTKRMGALLDEAAKRIPVLRNEAEISNMTMVEFTFGDEGTSAAK